jgi:hypothetical protein
MKLSKALAGGDLRSIGKSNSIILTIKNQKDFDTLFRLLFHSDRLVVMRAADAIEKITLEKTHYLKKHKKEIIGLLDAAKNKELKWHLALLIPRLPLGLREFNDAWDILAAWTLDKKNSRIVRVNSIQGLFEMTKPKNKMSPFFDKVVSQLEKENIPSVQARVKAIRKSVTRIEGQSRAPKVGR